MKKIFAIVAFFALWIFGCSAGTSPSNNANNAPNRTNENTLNAAIDNNSNVNNIANQTALHEPQQLTKNSNGANQAKSNANVNSVKKQKTDSLVENVNKKASEMVNNQNGAVKKIKKNVDKLIKDLP